MVVVIEGAQAIIRNANVMQDTMAMVLCAVLVKYVTKMPECLGFVCRMTRMILLFVNATRVIMEMGSYAAHAQSATPMQSK